MYFPRAKAAQTTVHVDYADGVLAINHDYQVHPVRSMFLRSKVENVLLPLLAELTARDWIRPDWRTRMKAALMCCPLLTIKLADPRTLPPEIAFLGLASAVEMGADNQETRSLIDQVLDEASCAGTS